MGCPSMDRSSHSDGNLFLWINSPFSNTMAMKDYFDLGEFLEARNPLAFKDSKQKIMFFETYKEAYLELLERLYKAGPKYIDLVLFVINTYGMSKPDAERWVGRWKSLGVNSEQVLLNWYDIEGADLNVDRELVAKIAKCLHTLVESKFNSDMFLAAWNEFIEKLNMLPKSKKL